MYFRISSKPKHKRTKINQAEKPNDLLHRALISLQALTLPLWCYFFKYETFCFLNRLEKHYYLELSDSCT